MNQQITARVTISGGRLLSAANADRIIARSTRASDPCGNMLPSPIDRYRNCPPYFQRWVIKKEPKGYIFREVNHAGGINGCHKTIRSLVQATLTLTSSAIVVEVLP
jgi:hypothetical protein